MKRIAVVVGTVPEAVKLAPVCRSLVKYEASASTEVILSGQHGHRVLSVLRLFGITPQHDLSKKIIRRGLAPMTASILRALADTFERLCPDVVIVQGDTATAFAGALAAFYHGIPVAHVEAGLTSGDVSRPFPEELHRAVISQLATLLFAPSMVAAMHARKLARRNAQVSLTGNPVVDALVRMTESGVIPNSRCAAKLERRCILVSVHRRENHGKGGERIAQALMRIARRRPDIDLLFVSHPHPALGHILRRLQNCSRVRVLPPQEYPAWLKLLSECDFVVSDSGGAQEEASWLGKPLLVVREETERQEVVDKGAAKLVGSDPKRIYESAMELLNDSRVAQRMRLSRKHYPYGRGTAASQIAAQVVKFVCTEHAGGRASNGEGSQFRTARIR